MSHAIIYDIHLVPISWNTFVLKWEIIEPHQP